MPSTRCGRAFHIVIHQFLGIDHFTIIIVVFGVRLTDFWRRIAGVSRFIPTAQHRFHFFAGFTTLRAMSFINNHRIIAVRQLTHFVDHKRKLL